MSDRLTKKWTNTLEEAYGATGSKGRSGELFALKVWKHWGYQVQDFEDQRSKQLAGCDIQIQKPSWKRLYSMDIKNNIDEKGGFFIELYNEGWLFNASKKSHRICHVNPEKLIICWYDRYRMQNALLNRITRTEDALLYIPYKSHSALINWRNLGIDAETE